MPERDGYIPGVPCWIDTSQPDPDAACDFYRGLFGWEFEDTMPQGSPGKYFIGRIRGGDVAAVGSIPEGAPNEHGSLNFNTLVTRNAEAAAAFYGAVFGWQMLTIPAGVMWTLPGYGDHLEEKTPGLREQMTQMGAPEGFIDVVAALNPIADGDAETPAHWRVTFTVDDAAATAAKAFELGGEIVSGPVDAPWARLAVINDPQGATFVASQFVPENKDLTA